MNRIKNLSFLSIILFFCNYLVAQSDAHKWSVGAGYTVSNMEGLFNQKNLRPINYTGASKLFIGRYLTSSFNLRLEGEYGSVFYPIVTFYPEREAGMYKQENFFDASFLVEYKLNNNYLFKENSTVQPYLFLGIGTNNMNKDWNAFFPFGAGLKFKVTKCLAINLETTFKVNIDNSYNYLQHHAGLVFSFGKKKKSDIEDATLVNKINNDLQDLSIVTSDYDKDGIDDANDECPYVSGTKEMNGCPDTDGDGIADSRDNCPTIKGDLDNQGCPPKVIDTDQDGVADANDKCPTEKGLMSNNGCPFDPDLSKIEEAKKIVKEEVKVIESNTIKLSNSTELFYQLSNSELTDEHKKILDAIAGYIIEENFTKVIVKGYTSNTGNDRLNIDLSMARALKVSNYLSLKGVNMRKISVQGWGAYNPKYNNAIPEEALKNQRVEIVLE